MAQDVDGKSQKGEGGSPRFPEKDRFPAKDILQIDRLFFAGLLVVAIGAVVQLLQVEVECAKEDWWVGRIFGFPLEVPRCFPNLDAPLTASLLCFAVSIPGLAANLVTITLSMQSKDTKLYPELRLPFAGLLAKFWKTRIPESEKAKDRNLSEILRSLAIRTAQLLAFLGIVILFLHFHVLAALLFLLSATVTYVLTFTFFVTLQKGQAGQEGAFIKPPSGTAK